MKDPFDSLYMPDPNWNNIFGKNLVWELNRALPHAQDVIIAKIPHEPDGFDVEVSVMACPAQFWMIHALPTPNSCNEKRKGFTVSAGTGQKELMVKIAEAIASGMISAKSDK